MNKEGLRQNATIAAAEAHLATFGARLAKRADQGFIKRVGKAVAGNIFKKFVDLPLFIEKDTSTYELVNCGHENIIYSSDTESIKVNIRTFSTDLEAVKVTRRRSESDYKLCRGFLGRHMLETRYDVVEFMNGYAVECRQSNLNSLREFSGVAELLEVAATTGMNTELWNFYTAIAHLHSETGYYPDILGDGNIALVEDAEGQQQLVILDSQTASPETQETFVPNKDIRVGEAIKRQMALFDEYFTGFKEPI